MKFTKLLALLLVAVMSLAVLAACDGGKTPEQNTEDTSDVTTQEPSQDTTEDSTEGTTEDTSDEVTTEPAPEYQCITVAEAIALCGTEDGYVTTERYYIRATVTSILNAAYGQMIIADETGSIEVYGTYSADGEIGYSAMDDKPYKGDEVVLHCILQNYQGKPEVKNARLIEFTHVEVDVDLTKYTDMSIADAREAAKGTLIKADGVVAKITYANGHKPNGFYLVDNTGSIYVFDSNLAQRVAEGDKLTIAAEKDYWILDTEQGNAASFGYQGSCQLANANLIEQDNSQKYDFDKSWITESTVKDILETPVTENVTTNIYKVNALVKKVPGNGFVNYYFFDIDGQTGNYTYTQCNGSDFEWLDEFDGKICTVYLSPINCKATPGDCFFRLLPVAVKDEGFTFDSKNAPAFALKYYAMDQFMPSYSADPALEVITSLSSELLGFSGVTITYTSSNNSVLSFASADGKTAMHCISSGTVTVTVTATLGDVTATDTVEIVVDIADEIDAGNVLSAINAATGEVVTVKGIVGPSLVNKVGFYLIDETGVIAVQTTAEVMATIKIGDMVVVSGTRDVKTKGGSNYFGQSNLYESTVVANYYGNHTYSTASFVTDKTLKEVYDLDPLVDYTTTVFKLTATVLVEDAAYYSNIYLTDGNGTQLRLYCSSASQYNWLKAYAGQEITVEVAACNWNDKNYYTGCVLAVETAEGKVFNTVNFQ